MNAYTLITGASSGIGRALAVRFSASRPLILQGRNLARLQETKSLCANPDQHLLWPAELNHPDSLQQDLAQLLADQHAPLDCFIHCAGTFQVGPVRLLDHAAAQQMMNVNCISALLIVGALMKNKINDRHLENVVFISSTASIGGAKGLAAYSASKGALDSAMRSLAVELAPRVRVNSIAPGAIRTAATEAILKDNSAAGSVDDVVDAAEFLTSAKARWITGHQLVVDGGRAIDISL